MSDATTETPFDGVYRGLCLEARKQVNDEFVRVYQLIVFKGFAFMRPITTTNPKKHWKHHVIGEAARGWLETQVSSLESQDYTLTTEPYLVEATPREYTELVMTGATPRNVILRANRVRAERGLPSATDPISS